MQSPVSQVATAGLALYLIQLYTAQFSSPENGLLYVSCLERCRTRSMFFCHKDSFHKVTVFCWCLGEKLNKAFKRCGYKVVDFGAKLASTSSAMELNASAFASMFFIEKFKGSQDSNFQKFTWKEDWVS